MAKVWILLLSGIDEENFKNWRWKNMKSSLRPTLIKEANDLKMFVKLFSIFIHNNIACRPSPTSVEYLYFIASHVWLCDGDAMRVKIQFRDESGNAKVAHAFKVLWSLSTEDESVGVRGLQWSSQNAFSLSMAPSPLNAAMKENCDNFIKVIADNLQGYYVSDSFLSVVTLTIKARECDAPSAVFS